MLKKEDVETYLSLHNVISEEISKVIGLYGIIADKHYSICDVGAEESGFMVHVEYYKWQDTDWEYIFVSSDLLYDANKLNELQSEANLANQKRIVTEEGQKQKELEHELEKARLLLAKHADKSN